MNNEFTPGPWSAKHEHNTVWIWGPKNKKIIAHKPLGIKDESVEENISNGRLIASAPDLLEALQQIVANPEHFVACKQCHWEDSLMVLSEEDVKKADQWQALLDLIAKATGKTQNQQA
jgi:hypothetical protein